MSKKPLDNLFADKIVIGGTLEIKCPMTDEEAELWAKKILLSYTGQCKKGRIVIVSDTEEGGIRDATDDEIKSLNK